MRHQLPRPPPHRPHQLLQQRLPPLPISKQIPHRAALSNKILALINEHATTLVLHSNHIQTPTVCTIYCDAHSVLLLLLLFAAVIIFAQAFIYSANVHRPKNVFLYAKCKTAERKIHSIFSKWNWCKCKWRGKIIIFICFFLLVVFCFIVYFRVI